MRNRNYFKIVMLVLSITFIAHSKALAEWNIIDIGSGVSDMFGITLSSGRNDGINRIYGANANAHVYEFTFSGYTWNKVDMGADKGAAVGAMTCIASGNGRNDGVIRIYAGNADCDLDEYSFSAGKWSEATIGGGGPNTQFGLNGMALGNGRNDASIRVYAACDDCHIYEFTWTGSTWTRVDLGNGGASASMSKVTVGDGRGDGIIRVYASNNNAHLYEFTYSGSGDSWIVYDMGGNADGTNMRNVAIGNGRSDGVNRVYAANSDGRPFEYSFSNSTWAFCCVDNSQLTNTVNWLEGIAVADGHNDGVSRLYGADYDSHLYEYNFTASTFTRTSMGLSGNNMQAIVAGNGRNDGIVRIYAANTNFHVYEFSYSTSSISLSNNAIYNARVYPTFANLSKGEKIKFANFTPNAQIIILSLSGHIIKTLYADPAGNVAPWDGSVDIGGKAGSGTYIIHGGDNAGGYKLFKILLIK